MADRKKSFAAFAACAAAGFAAGILLSPFRNGVHLNVNVNSRNPEKHGALKAEAGSFLNVGGKKLEDTGD